LHAAASSLLVPFVKLARTLSDHRDGIVNAIRLRLSNARLEAMNSTVRLISHRSRGFRRIDSLLALIRLVCGRVPVALPTRMPEEPLFRPERLVELFTPLDAAPSFP
jgi:hypothetical protein